MVGEGIKQFLRLGLEWETLLGPAVCFPRVSFLNNAGPAVFLLALYFIFLMLGLLSQCSCWHPADDLVL